MLPLKEAGLIAAVTTGLPARGMRAGCNRRPLAARPARFIIRRSRFAVLVAPAHPGRSHGPVGPCHGSRGISQEIPDHFPPHQGNREKRLSRRESRIPLFLPSRSTGGRSGSRGAANPLRIALPRRWHAHFRRSERLVQYHPYDLPAQREPGVLDPNPASWPTPSSADFPDQHLQSRSSFSWS